MERDDREREIRDRKRKREGENEVKAKNRHCIERTYKTPWKIAFSKCFSLNAKEVIKVI